MMDKERDLEMLSAACDELHAERSKLGNEFYQEFHRYAREWVKRGVLKALESYPELSIELNDYGKLKEMHLDVDALIESLPVAIEQDIMPMYRWLFEMAQDSREEHRSSLVFNIYDKQLNDAVARVLKKLEAVLKRYNYPCSYLTYDSWNKFYVEQNNEPKINEIELKKIISQTKDNYKRLLKVQAQIDSLRKSEISEKVGGYWKQCDDEKDDSIALGLVEV
jgi:biotin-(acetyl-CoA carboxylase) ligase